MYFTFLLSSLARNVWSLWGLCQHPGALPGQNPFSTIKFIIGRVVTLVLESRSIRSLLGSMAPMCMAGTIYTTGWQQGCLLRFLNLQWRRRGKEIEIVERRPTACNKGTGELPQFFEEESNLLYRAGIFSLWTPQNAAMMVDTGKRG